ncbi:MAG: sodium:alanine symporter family protein [Phycisphaerales bacterium]|nr:MAG: sodium:alanine symporter family protein [Phycisphaerales bacterium]
MEAVEKFCEDLVGWIWSTPLFFLLLGAGLIFSIVTKFVQYRILSHGVACIRGHYDRPEDTGHISHFQALSAALSATIGLGNIAGVAVAVTLGGPGAVFWMWLVGLFGMTLKFVECSLAVMFRDVRDVPDPSAPALTEADAEERTLEYPGEPPPEPGARVRGRGEVRGGPMWYIQKALVEPLRARGNGLWVLFRVLAVLFAAATVLNSFGSGNMFQGWNVSNVLEANFHLSKYVSAPLVAGLVALVIIGGIRRIGQVAARLVPFMCILYVLAALYIIVAHADEVTDMLALIIRSAFTPTAEAGAFTGASVWIAFEWGLRRACFSNEAGEGSAAMAHAAARTEEPIREGVVAGIGPFVDTLIICTMSAMVLLMTRTYDRPAIGTVESIEDQRVVVTTNKDLPEKMARAYLREVVPGAKVGVYVHREAGEETEQVKCLVSDVVAEGEGWDRVRSLVLIETAEDNTDENRALLALGQPVHLDMDGAEMTRFAFDTAMPGFGLLVVTVGVCLFAFSTMISWSYYGEKGAEYLLGPGAILPYKFVFVIFVFLGMVLPEFSLIYDFSDATVGLMVMCNVPAILILSPYVIRAARNYFERLDGGQMPRTR